LARVALSSILLVLTVVILIVAVTCNGGGDEPAPESPAQSPEALATPTPEPDTTTPEAPAETDPSPEPDPSPDEPVPSPEPDVTPEEPAPEEPAGEPELTTVTDAVNMPGSIVFTPDGRILFNEIYDGRIRVIQDGQLLDQPFAELAIAHPPRYTEHGLLGLALDPEFASNGYVYAFYTVADE
jgi:glucose/arabinose dehydrogenase